MKLFEKILDRRIQTWSERIGILSDLQGLQGRQGHGGPAVHSQRDTAIRREQGMSTFLCFIDVSKAMTECGGQACGSSFRSMGWLGAALTLFVQCIQEFEAEAGAPQGAVLFPFLYATL
jgi:hypothetical protein